MPNYRVVDCVTTLPIDVNIVSGAGGAAQLRLTDVQVVNITSGTGTGTYTLVTVPNTTGLFYHIRNVQMLLTTDATAANRTPHLHWYTAAAAVYHRSPQPAVLQTASLALYWEWSRNLAVINSTINNSARSQTLPDVWMPKEHYCQLTIQAGQAGDTVTLIYVVYEIYELL